MIDAIGGYFGLAERDLENGRLPVEGIGVNTARNALEYILRQLPDVDKVYLPLYTCESVLEPIKMMQIPFHFYHINMQLEMVENVQVDKGTYTIVNNYFGLKDAYVANLAEKYGEALIVDNAQALFAPVLPNVRAIYSARKFVGVADGGFVTGVPELPLMMYEEDTTEHNSHLQIRKEYGAEAGFEAYRKNEKLLDNQPIRMMAISTKDILTHIDYNKVVTKRRENYQMLHSVLKDKNRLQLPDMDNFACPMVYPFLPKSDTDIRNKLIENRIYVARYWQNVLNWHAVNDVEACLAKNLTPLPIDQRYGVDEMKYIVSIINQIV